MKPAKPSPLLPAVRIAMTAAISAVAFAAMTAVAFAAMSAIAFAAMSAAAPAAAGSEYISLRRAPAAPSPEIRAALSPETRAAPPPAPAPADGEDGAGYADGESAARGLRSVRVEGRKIIVTSGTGAPVDYKIKGVCYSNDADGLSFYENLERDLPLLKAIHANSIRTFRPLAAYKEGTETVELDYEKTRHMLDRLAASGISVTVGFDSARDIVGGIRDDATGRVFREAFYLEYINAFAAHPAVLAWAFGNEYNYKYAEWFDGDKNKWLGILAGAVKNARAASPRPAAVVHGELPGEAEMREYQAIPGLDLVMLNVYRGPSFGGLYKDWTARTRTAPMPAVLAEFGRSSMDGKGNDTGALQAEWIGKLWAEIEAGFDATGAGGYLFSLKDEAWKGDSDSGPNIGVENRLGIFTADGRPKEAARLLMRLWKPEAAHENP
ncbi:MAG: hypothetical protein LBI02_01180 [Opitutaceae bacterium]|nr:hypothetical protein [Opitutaceae bacterium]